jgi:putative FmdB family regulatory protein
MPIYDFRCPNGHVFERFQRMSDPRPEACEVCGAGPLEVVLYPVPVHFKGSGFYSTDYGRGKAKRTDGTRDGGDSSSSSSDSSSSSSDGDSNVKQVDSKAAEA